MWTNALYNGILFVALASISNFATGQNLIRNPSFERFRQCPVKLGNLEQDVEDWQTPTFGSTDYFNACSKAMGTPKNFNGEQPAHFGVGYVGFYMLAPDDYREYVQAQLTRPLQKGESYTVSFYVSLAEKSDFAVGQFGIRFFEKPVKIKTKKVLSTRQLSKLPGDTSNYIEITSSEFYSDSEAWIFLTKEFVAKGTENYMIIGNFKDNRRTQRFQTQRKENKGAYYYLDMVSVQRTHTDKNGPNIFKQANLELDSVHVFKDILFDFNTATLRNTEQEELEEVFLFLNENPSVYIHIGGHTDAVGATTFNNRLSLERAKTVANYLIKRGILADRIHYGGFGSSKPIATNTTKAGRLRNRRVEFVLMESSNNPNNR